MTNTPTHKINLVLLTDCIKDINAGAEKQIFELAQGLPKDQYNVFIASLGWEETMRDLIETTGCRLDIFLVTRIYGLSGLIQGIRFYSFLRQHHINVLLTYHLSSDMWGTFWGHLAGVPVILSNRRDMGFWRNAWHIKAYRTMDRWVKKIVVVSQSIKQMVIETEGVVPESIEVIYNGVDIPVNISPTTSGDFKKELGIKDEDLVIMHVANLAPIKGHIFLLQAFKKIAAQYKNVKLVLVGEDKLNGSLQNQTNQMGTKDHVLFLGKRKDVRNLLAIADICVLPSLSEGMSNAILEYMAAAKPVVATNVGGNPELVRNEFNGLLVEKENAEQLKEALLKLIQDKEKRRIMGQNGLLKVKGEFSMGAMIGRYDQLFKENSPIRILHLVSSGGLFGAEQVILTLAGCTQGIVHFVGALNNQHNPHLEIIEEAKKRGLNTAVFESKGRFDLSTIKQVEDFVLKNNIDIIHTHNYKANLIGAWAARKARKKWLATVHGWIGTDARLRWYENFDSFVLKFANQIVCVSEPNYQDLLKKGFSPEHLAVIFNGIDLKRFSRGPGNLRLKQELGIGHGTVIAIVGRLAPEKGHKILFEAMAQIIKKDPDIKLLVIGDGPLKNTLQEQIKELNLSGHIIMTGIRKDMPDIYGLCDILVNASYTEGLPMTILEAMACKVAVIATRVGAVGQIIQNNKNGLLLGPNDPQALALALSQLIKDPHKRRQLAQEAYTDVTGSFSDQAMFNKYKEKYRILIK